MTSGQDRARPGAGRVVQRRHVAPDPPAGRPPARPVFSPTAVLEVREAPLLPPAVQAAYRDVTLALTKDARATEAMAAALQKAVADDGLLYRDDAYEVQPFPLLLGASDVEALSWTFQSCCELVEKVVDLYVADPDVLRIAERWASEDALAAHGQAEHQKAFGRALRDLGIVEMSVKTWDGSFSRTLMGD